MNLILKIRFGSGSGENLLCVAEALLPLEVWTSSEHEALTTELTQRQCVSNYVFVQSKQWLQSQEKVLEGSAHFTCQYDKALAVASQ